MQENKQYSESTLTNFSPFFPLFFSNLIFVILIGLASHILLRV